MNFPSETPLNFMQKKLMFYNLNNSKFSGLSKSAKNEQKKTYATNPSKKATGPPPIRRIFLWQESKMDDGLVGARCVWLWWWWWKPFAPFLLAGLSDVVVAVGPIKWAGERNIFTKSFIFSIFSGFSQNFLIFNFSIFFL